MAGATIAATGLALQIDDTIYTGDTIDIGVLFEPENTTNKLIKWELVELPGNIVQLDETGRLIANLDGEFKITANLMDGSGIMVSKKVVIETPVSSINPENKSILKDLVSVYPNPSSDGRFFINIDPELSVPLKIMAFDITGRMLCKTFIEEKGSILLNHRFANGVYFVNFVAEEYSIVRKLIVD